MTEAGTTADLVEHLLRHRTLGAAPRRELEWLAAHGRLRTYAKGQHILARSDPVDNLFIVVSGHFVIHVDRGAGPKMVMEWRDGDVSGLLPFSRLRYTPGDTVATEPVVGIEVSRDMFPEMIRECPAVTGMLVHVMLDRARVFNSSELHDEKMMSLGRLAAGLAHELNNPASAAMRSATRLTAALYEAEEASRALGAVTLTSAQQAVVTGVRDLCQTAATSGARLRAPMEALDREDAMAAWLAAHGVDVDGAAALAESQVTVEALDALAASLPREALTLALRWIVTNFEARGLTVEIERAVTRVHDLVAAIKRFSYLDQQRTTESIDVAQGLNDTAVLLGAKARASSATVTVEVEPGLPRVRGIGGELNQIWLNLLENALDAVAPSPQVRATGARTSGAIGTGRVTVSARREDDAVVVRIVDNGPGIPAEHVGRIFDPFFTTKPQGQGTGLGLDIAQRIARAHGGVIEVDSEPGRTEFRLSLPVAGEGAAPPAPEAS